MKILIFYQYFGTPKGKWSTRIYEFTKRWVAEGNEVTIVTSPYEKSDIKVNKFIERQQIEGINLIIINSADSNRDGVAKRVFKAVTFSLISCYFALTERCDKVLASSGPITVGLPVLLAKWIRRKPMIFEVRDLWPEGAIELGKLKNPVLQKIAIWFEKICYKNSSLVVPCSKGMEAGILKKVPNTRTLVVPNASDVQLFSDFSPIDQDLPEQYVNKKLFLYAGSLGLMDEVEQIIEGMRLVNDNRVHLLIIGDGAEKKCLERLVEKYKLNNIEFLGIMPKNEVVVWFSRVVATFVTFKDLAVLHTSSPNKMFDSFAAGQPIIQSTRGWIKELVDNTACGINVDPNDPQTFANAMELMSSDVTYRNQMAINAKKLALTEFNRDILAVKYLDHITSL